MDHNFWGEVSAAVGRSGTWGVHLRYPFPLALGGFFSPIKVREQLPILESRTTRESEMSFLVKKVQDSKVANFQLVAS